ncbi:hypothetical protein SAMN04487950_4090 [Halogranum rubrum]|uniref:DUF7999 domain-containing protein n=1 Tax=Halogranum rubrum TaxID=553466 RepID=A0A1I4IB27_9EURY|nr:hypothetical protein [Halogranum rubrum]SFL51485.1 hypothetical protein SAMN04487950_4090 [Halogranum rubrum]
MAHTQSKQDVEMVRIRREMNDHHTMTVEVVDSNATRYVVEYDSADLERTLTALPVGATVPLQLEPIGARSNVWRAVGMGASTASRDETAVPLVD